MAALIFFGISLFYFLPAFLPGQHIYGTDYIAGGYPFYDFISDRFHAGELPKWVPYVFGGMPMFANPGSMFYPVHVLADLLVPTSRIFPFVFWFQFGVAGLGMYLLARELGCRKWVALVAGIAFQFTGIIASWVYGGHDGRIIVATLGPLFFFFLHRGIRLTEIGSFAGAGATLGFALLSFQIQNAYYLILAGFIWAIFSLVSLEVYRDGALLGKTLALGLGSVAFAFILNAVNFLPFVGYVPESPRGDPEGRGWEYSISFSMPVPEILSMAVPEQAGASVSDPVSGAPQFPRYQGQNGFKLHTEYVGAFVLIMLALGAYYCRRERYWWFFFGLSLFFLTLALGGNTPLYRIYYEVLPGIKRFRAPSLAFYVVAMSLVIMAAVTLERLARLRDADVARRSEPGDTVQLVGLISTAVVVLAVLGAGVVGTGPSEPGFPDRLQGWQRFILFSAGVAGTLWLWSRAKLGMAGAAIVLALLTAADLGLMARRFFHTVVPPEQMFAPDDVALFLQGRPRPDRVWAMPLGGAGIGTWGGNGSYGGNYPMLHGIEQVGGEHPNPLQRWHEYVGAGTATYIDWRNLIIEPHVVEHELGQALGFQSAPGFLDAANVRYVVSLVPLAHEEFREVHRGSALVYENATVLPRAYLVPALQEVEPGTAVAAMRGAQWDPRQIAFVHRGSGIALPEAPLQGSAQVITHEPDRVVVRTSANRPALLVLADNWYEGWTATIDGAPAEVHLANHTFRGVVVPAGEHNVEFAFEPRSMFIGFSIYIICLALLGAYAALLIVRARRRPPPEAVPG
jgi:hypothetical protein